MSPQIKCAVVARGTFVVCEYDASDDFNSTEDLLESARRVLGRIPRNSSDTYTFLGHHFHYTSGSGDRDDDLNYVCVAGQEAGVDLPFKFLREVKSKFPLFYNRPIGRNAAESKEAMATKFIKRIMDEYNRNTGGKVEHMERELNEVGTVMKDNLQKVMDRGEAIGSLVDKTDMLRTEAQRYRQAGKSLNDQIWWREKRTSIIVGLVLLFILWWMLSSHCGGWFLPTCRGVAPAPEAVSSYSELEEMDNSV